MPENKRKKGETEAMHILQLKGYEFDTEYSDENIGRSMPDLRYKNGRYLEVTHTAHNDSIPLIPNKYSKLSTAKQLEISERAYEANERMTNFKYEFDSSGARLTEKGQRDYEKDAAIIKSHYGYDVKTFDFGEKFSEFNCDNPIICMSSDNVLKEITKDKGKKYTDGNTDLFIFVTDGEMNSVDNLIDSRDYNLASVSFFNAVRHAPFKNIFLCEWDWDRQQYELESPNILLMRVEDDEVKTIKL